MKLDLHIHIKSYTNIWADLTLDATMGFKGSIGAGVTYDTSKIGDLAKMIAGFVKEPRAAAAAGAIGSIASLLSWKVLGNIDASSGANAGVVGKIKWVPTYLEGMTIQQQQPK